MENKEEKFNRKILDGCGLPYLNFTLSISPGKPCAGFVLGVACLCLSDSTVNDHTVVHFDKT